MKTDFLRAIRGLLLVVGACAHLLATAAEPISLVIKGKPLSAEVAATDDERNRGLMGRTTLAPDAGMLFVFPRDGQYAMWMKNTPLPLSVAFIDASGRIVNIETMTPLTLDPHGAHRPVRYALEMNAGWFARQGIRPGDRIQGLPPAEVGR